MFKGEIILSTLRSATRSKRNCMANKSNAVHTKISLEKKQATKLRDDLKKNNATASHEEYDLPEHA